MRRRRKSTFRRVAESALGVFIRKASGGRKHISKVGYDTVCEAKAKRLLLSGVQAWLEAPTVA